MTLIQNYIGLDARIEAIVRALMGDVDVDLTDYYTKEEVDALIASGGTGLQINYNDLLNRPIIDGLMQSNLDLNGHMLLYNSQRLYCPAVIDNIITFDSDVSIPNVYTKSEVDALIAGGGEPIDAYTKDETDGLLALKANAADVYTKTECDEKYFNKTQQGFNFYSDGTYDYNGGSADQECSVAYFGKTDVMKMRFCGGSRRCTFCTVGGVGRTDINLWSCTNWGWLAVGPNGNAFQPPYESGPAQAVLTVGPIRNGIDFRWKYEFDEEGAVTGGSPYLRIAGNEVWIPEKSVMQYRNDTDDVLFSKNAVIPNIYNKEEVDALIAGGGSIPDDLSVNTLTLNNTTGVSLRGTKFSSTDDYAVIVTCVSDDSSKELFSMRQDGRIHMDTLWSLVMGRFSYNIIDDNPVMHIFRFNGDSSGKPSTFLIQADTISFEGTLENVYTKEEVDALIAGGGGGTCRYNGPENTGSTSHIGETWQLNFESNDNPAYVNALTFAQPDKSSFLSISCNHTQKSISFREGGISGGGVTIYPQKNELFVPGKVQASNIEAQTGLLVTGPTTLNMRADVTDLNINGSNCNVYTKEEVDAKVAGGVGLLVKGNDTDGNVENINAEINATPDGYAKMFKTNYNGSYQMQTVFTVKLDASRIFSLMFPKDSNLFRFQTILNGAWHTVVGTTSASQTITHEAPYVGEPDEYSIGDPVFASGRVCKFDMMNNEWTTETGATDCICEVKPEGTVGEYMGICVGFNENTKSLIFATHGDYYFNVADSSKYKIGDIILLDGSVLKDDMALTGKVMKMIVGKITGKINKTTVAVLKD